MNTITNQKQDAFKYFLFLLNKNYREVASQKQRNVYALSAVKIMKFLFFSVVLKIDSLLKDDLFSNWYALPKGPIEDDCYGFLKKTAVKKEADDYGKSTEHTESIGFENIQPGVKSAIEDAIKILREKDLLLLDEESLVELSHKWNAWSSAFLKANLRGRKAGPMDTEMIKSEPVYI